MNNSLINSMQKYIITTFFSRLIKLQILPQLLLLSKFILRLVRIITIITFTFNKSHRFFFRSLIDKNSLMLTINKQLFEHLFAISQKERLVLIYLEIQNRRHPTLPASFFPPTSQSTAIYLMRTNWFKTTIAFVLWKLSQIVQNAKNILNMTTPEFQSQQTHVSL